MCIFFFFNDTATTEIYTLSLHDALPICHGFGTQDDDGGVGHELGVDPQRQGGHELGDVTGQLALVRPGLRVAEVDRSEEHTSELQSRQYLVCRLLLEKKKIIKTQLLKYF